jgi:hypothetical protein
VPWCSLLCGGVMKPVKRGLKNRVISLFGITQGCRKQNMTKTTGARAPLIVKKNPEMTLESVIMTGWFTVYASFKFCVIVCPGVTKRYSLLLYYFFMSFMT